MAGLGCGWHKAQFDNLNIEVDPSDANLALVAKASASSELDGDTTAAKVCDGEAYTTRWSAAEGRTSGEWIELDFGVAGTFNSATLKQFEDRITGFKIQCWKDTEWADVYAGKNLGAAPKRLSFPPVTARRVRLLVTESKSPPSLWEFELCHRR
jgi:hypothetical protein